MPHTSLRLQWKLTLSYVLVTVGVAFCLDALVLLYLCYICTVSIKPGVILSFIEQHGRDIAPYVTTTPPNRDALHEWLRNGKTGMHQNVDLQYSIRMDVGHVERPIFAITDVKGRVLTCVPSEAFSSDAPLVDQLPATHAAAVCAALRGETHPEQLAFHAERGVTIAAAPILDRENKPVGVVYVREYSVTDYKGLVKSVAEMAFPMAAAVLLLAAIAGMLFGHLTARRITRRLQRIATAADTWRQGNFGARAGDCGGDELGQMARNLNRMAEELQALFNLRQEVAMLDERNRLARDLHDTVKQQVFATVMQLGAAQSLLASDPAAAGRHLAEAERLAHQAQFDLGAILRELRSTLPTGEGLAVALRGYVADWSRQTGITAEVSGELALSLSPFTEEALFRIIQEALANAARHSTATRVQVELSEDDGRVVLRITDNGKGFDPRVRTGGMGLRNMRERAEALPQGSYRVNSEPGIGTRITVVCWNEVGEHAGTTA